MQKSLCVFCQNIVVGMSLATVYRPRVKIMSLNNDSNLYQFNIKEKETISQHRIEVTSKTTNKLSRLHIRIIRVDCIDYDTFVFRHRTFRSSGAV